MNREKSRRRLSVFELSTVTQTQLKQQEEPLSQEIDQNLRTLALVHPFSDTAKTLLVKDAFMKKSELAKNHQAFFHVFHYLVNLIIGTVEYRKRFRWPVKTSRDEGDFREKALSYFNECHRNLKWPIGPFQMKVVHFPCGVDFMKIIVELTKLAMHAVLKQNDGIHLINSNGMSLQQAREILQATEELYAEMDTICSKIQVLAVPMKERTHRLKDFMRSLLENTSITEKMIDDGFLAAWEQKQKDDIEKKIMPEIERLENFYTQCNAFEQKLMAIKPMQISFDKNKMNEFGLLQMSENFNAKLDYDKLFEWFKSAMPELMNALYVKPPWSVQRLKRESQLLDKLIARADTLATRLEEITLGNSFRIHSTSRSVKITNSLPLHHWYENLMLTPTVKCPVHNDFRISIWEAAPAMDSPIRKVQQKITTTSDDTSGFCDGTGLSDITSLRTAKLDPMLMLNTAMQRKRGFKTKSSPLRNAFASSPSRLNSNMPFNSTMIPKDGNTSPLRRNLF